MHSGNLTNNHYCTLNSMNKAFLVMRKRLKGRHNKNLPCLWVGSFTVLNLTELLCLILNVRKGKQKGEVLDHMVKRRWNILLKILHRPDWSRYLQCSAWSPLYLFERKKLVRIIVNYFSSGIVSLRNKVKTTLTLARKIISLENARSLWARSQINI